MQEVVIVAAKRTAVGSFGGSLSAIPAAELGAAVILDLLSSVKLDAGEVDEVIFGQVLQAGCGQNPARIAAIKAGVPQEVPALTINKVCGSSMKAAHLAAQAISLGEADIIIAGGQENMSQAPHLLSDSRKGKRMGDWQMIDSMLRDGLTCALNNYMHMGITAENLAQKYQITRDDQDNFALESQRKASLAQLQGRFADEIVSIGIPKRKGELVNFVNDEFIKHEASFESMCKPRPAFIKENGTVTAANASGINDGAAALLLMSRAKADKLKLKPMVRLTSYASAGVDPKIMGIGPVPASKKALAKAGWTINQLDLIESNEAFAAQAIAVNKEMTWDTKKVNVNGGAIALGHPIGASGARIMTTLIHEMLRCKADRALATMCIGGGQGVATCFERI